MVLVASADEYATSLQKLFPLGEYWDKQFADAQSDVHLFCRVKAGELMRFRERMAALQSESMIETTRELIADWERVMLGHVTSGLDLPQRRLFLLSNRDIRPTRVELRAYP